MTKQSNQGKNVPKGDYSKARITSGSDSRIPEFIEQTKAFLYNGKGANIIYTPIPVGDFSKVKGLAKYL
jgi:hypothetical protein